MDDRADTLLQILAAPVNEERPWMVFGACRESDPDLFFSGAREEEALALAICASCPVRLECLDYALEARERFGIWGGMTEKQRRRERRRIA
jgi:WhiB family redox-sensing transcriptional regulator